MAAGWTAGWAVGTMPQIVAPQGPLGTPTRVGTHCPLCLPSSLGIMASPEHPGSPGWMGPITQCATGTEQEAAATGPDLSCPGPDEHLGELEAWGLIRDRGLKTSEIQTWALQQMPRERGQLS